MTDNGGTAGLNVFNAGMRSGKNTVYNGGGRAASFWRWPGAIRPADCDRLTAHIDVFPTLAGIAGVPLRDSVAAQVEGRSLLPLLADPNAPWAERVLFSHMGRWPKGSAGQSKYAHASVRSGPFIMVCSNRQNQRQWQLFNLTTDPGEKEDIADRHPDIVRRLETAYDQWWESVLPCMENENVVGPKVNPYHELYWQQFGRN